MQRYFNLTTTNLSVVKDTKMISKMMSSNVVKKGKVSIQTKWPTRPELIPVFVV